MLKKYSYILLSFFLILPAVLPTFYIFTAKETRVCGVDNKNYPSISYAKKLGVEISYNFPCLFLESEKNLFEKKIDFEFTGGLLDFFQDLNYSQFFIKNNFDKKEYFVIDNKTNKQKLENYFPGDQIKIKGFLNTNTKVVEAKEFDNISQQNLNTYNCVIKKNNELTKKLYCYDEDIVFEFSYNDKTRFVAGFINQASISDFKKGDFIRVRVDKNKKIQTLILKKRGNLKYLKNHIFTINAKLVSVDIKKNSLNVKLSSYPESISNINFDKNNLNIKLKINKNTRIVKKYFGKISLKDFKIGDDLYIIGKAKDGGKFEAVTIKNNSIWR